jgi:hypothetical protein
MGNLVSPTTYSVPPFIKMITKDVTVIQKLFGGIMFDFLTFLHAFLYLNNKSWC